MGPGLGSDRDIDLSIHFLTVHSIQGKHFRSDGAGFGSFTKGMGLNSYTTMDILNKFQFHYVSVFFFFLTLCHTCEEITKSIDITCAMFQKR